MKKFEVRIETFSHVTEDLDKVIRAMNCLIGFEIKNYRFKKLYGHWGNAIIHVFTEIYEKEANDFLIRLANVLSEEDKKYLSYNIDLHLDERYKLHLRFNKQKAFKNIFKISKGDDVIKVTISIPQLSKTAIVDFYKKIGLLL
jgi:RNA binding exosome subunit